MNELQIRRDALADVVIGAVMEAFQKLADHREDIARLWSEFAHLRPGETIKGCRTKKEFCETRLRRTPRAIQYMLAGGNPNNRREIISPDKDEAAKFEAKAKEITDQGDSVKWQDVEVIPELEAANEAGEYIPEQRKAKAETEKVESQTVILRQLFEQLASVKLVRLAPSTFNSGVPSSSGRYDITLNGLTPAQVKKVREVLVEAKAAAA